MIQQITTNTLSDVIDLFDQYRVFYKKESDLHTAEIYLRERLANNEAIIFAYYETEQEQTKQPIAFTLCYFTFSSTRMAKTLQLNDLFVLPTYRSQGIGEQLIHHVFSYAKANDYASVGIETAMDNYGAQKLYQRLGFVEDSSVHYSYGVA